MIPGRFVTVQFRGMVSPNAVITSTRGFQMASIHLSFFVVFLVECVLSMRKLKCLYR